MKFLVTLFVLSLVCGVAQAQSRRDSINVLGYVSGLAVSFQETNSYLGFGTTLDFDITDPCAGAPENTIKIVPGGGSFEANPYLIVCQGGSADSLSVAKPDFVIAGTCPDNYHSATVFDAANFFRSDGANANVEVTVEVGTNFACNGGTLYKDNGSKSANIGLTPSGYGSELYGLTFTGGSDGNLCISNTAPIQFIPTSFPCSDTVNYDVNAACGGYGLVAATTQDIVNHFTAGFTAEDAIRYLILRQDILRDLAFEQYLSCSNATTTLDYNSYNYPVQFIQTATSCPFDVNIPIVSSNSATAINVDSSFVLSGLSGPITSYPYTSYGCTSQVSAFNNQPVWTASRLMLLEQGPQFNTSNTNAFVDDNEYFYSSPYLACKFRADLNYLPVSPPSCSTPVLLSSEFYCVAKDSSACPCVGTYCTGSSCTPACCADFCPGCTC